MKKKQLELIEKENSQHGGTLKHPQRRKRPLSTSQSMHLVFRSSQAKGSYSLSKHKKEVEQIINKFAEKYYVSIYSLANVGNHIHLHIKLFRRHFYSPFIRAISAAIMMKVTGFSRWKPKPEGFQFWDKRPFSSIVTAIRYLENIKDYIVINQFEAMGLERWQARQNVQIRKKRQPS